MENRLNVEYIPVGQLKPYEKNARKHVEYDVGQIAHSIEEYGFNDPIGIWGKDNIYEIAAEYGVGGREVNKCKFCGKEINVLKWVGEHSEYHCGECVRYCMDKCKIALNSNTSWHKEPCISCEHNPYAKQYVFRGGEWQKRK